MSESSRTTIDASALRARLFAFADDSMQGRQSGEIGNVKASEYVAAEFRRLGLQPAGEGGTYFQTVPLAVVGPDPASRLTVGGEPLVLGSDVVPVNLAVGTRPIDGVQVVFGGPANDPSHWITATQAAGKLVVLSLPAGPDGARGYVRPSAVAADPRFANAAAIAIGELDLLPPSVVAGMLGGTLAVGTSQPVAVPLRLLLSPRAAERLLGAAPQSLTPGALGGVLRGEIGIRRAAHASPSRNVIAILPGSDPTVRDQYIALTAHNDHIGMTTRAVDHDSLRAYNRIVRPAGADSPDRPATAEQMIAVRALLDSVRRQRPARPDSIMNGADDDGSGTVSLLEIARALASRLDRPRRSILFVSHSAEELGLLGSAWFTDHPTVERDSIVAELDMDMVGRGNATDLPEGGTSYLEVVGVRRLSREFGDVLERVAAREPVPFVFNYEYDAPGHPLQYYCRADHYSYARYGIPSVSLSRGGHVDYHQVTDEPQYIDYAALARVSNFVRDAAVEIANLDHRLVVDQPKGDPRAPCRQ
jgi:peptidase M28-like protein